eukprot:gene32198-41447_t
MPAGSGRPASAALDPLTPILSHAIPNHPVETDRQAPSQSPCAARFLADGSAMPGSTGVSIAGRGWKPDPEAALTDRFVSHFTNRLDAKGRVSIPASFRGVLARDGYEGLYVFPAPDPARLACGGHAPG